MTMNVKREEIESARSIQDALGEKTLGRAARLAPLGIFCLGILFALHVASSLVAPMCAAIIVGVVLSRLGDRAHAVGIPSYVLATLAVIGTGVAIILAGGALTSRLSDLIERAPELATRLSALAARVTGPLQMLKHQMFGTAAEQTAAPNFDLSAATGILGGLTPALGGVLIFLATLFFFVAGKTGLRRRIVLIPRRREARLSTLRILNGVEEALEHYFGSAALIYGALALVTAALAWATGLGSPLLWGIFVFFACFVPFLGVALVTVALLVAGFTTHDGLLGGLAPAGIYLVAHTLLENVLLPAVVGRRFEVNPFMVFVSILFWTWMWGALGAVIASPMLLIFKIVIEELRDAEKPELPS